MVLPCESRLPIPRRWVAVRQYDHIRARQQPAVDFRPLFPARALLVALFLAPVRAARVAGRAVSEPAKGFHVLLALNHIDRLPRSNRGHDLRHPVKRPLPNLPRHRADKPIPAHFRVGAFLQRFRRGFSPLSERFPRRVLEVIPHHLKNFISLGIRIGVNSVRIIPVDLRPRLLLRFLVRHRSDLDPVHRLRRSSPGIARRTGGRFVCRKYRRTVPSVLPPGALGPRSLTARSLPSLRRLPPVLRVHNQILRRDPQRGHHLGPGASGVAVHIDPPFPVPRALLLGQCQTRRPVLVCRAPRCIFSAPVRAAHALKHPQNLA